MEENNEEFNQDNLNPPENEIEEFFNFSDENEDSRLDEDSSQSNSLSDSQMGSEHSSGTGSGEETKNPSKQRIRAKKQKKINFNRNLPATHSYLGDDLEDAGGGQAVMDAEDIKEGVPLFAVPNLILMPGQTLPLQNLTLRYVSMFQQIIAHHRLFAVLTMRAIHNESGYEYELARIGTLAQVKEYKEETEAEVTHMKAKAVGRQRFELIEKHGLIDGMEDTIRQFSVRGRGLSTSSLIWYVRFIKQSCQEEIIDQMVSELSCWYISEEHRIRRMAENRTEFSYWVASNLPIDDLQKLQLLSINCTLQRLKCELLLLKKRCDQVLGDKSDIFSMSIDGPMGAYVNPGGVIHEMFTLLSARGISVVTKPETQNSWFPGYAWSILECSGCHLHAGWRFTSTKKNLKPSKFWGLTRASIKPKMKDNEQEYTK